jgi:hypothetical protein
MNSSGELYQHRAGNGFPLHKMNTILFKSDWTL